MKLELIDERYQEVKKKIKIAAKKAGRNHQDIDLIAVSKNHSVKKIKYLRDKGIKVFGENRVQELQEKAEKIKDINWHFIGHLQRNKVKYLMRMKNCLMIHSLDSLRLAREINKRAQKNNRVMPVLVEVNISGDKNKFGFPPPKVKDFFDKVFEFSNIKICGLMTIVPYLDNPEKTRPYFKQMFLLKKNLEKKGYNIEKLSMGMSNDYEVAIEEGANMVRVGTALFGERGEK